MVSKNVSDHWLNSKLQIFSDGADFHSMVAVSREPFIKGFTTNPSLMKQCGVTDYRNFALKLIEKIPDKSISFEVFSDDLKEMKRQALEIHQWGPHVFVKIPVMNSEGVSTVSLIHELSQKGISLNITAILTLGQVWEVCQALKGGSSVAYISVFAGRIADTGRDPLPIMQAALALCRMTGQGVKLLWASTREVWNIFQAEQLGVDIITAPLDQIKKLSLWQTDLTAYSQKTVQDFKRDAEIAGLVL